MAQPAFATKATVPSGPIEDASLRNSSSNLDSQAAAAALYANNRDSAVKNGYEFLDSDYKLSSAGAAASLKYANPQDLPSFPSSGLRSGNSAASAAASLGWSNQKTFQHWKPDPSSHASTAAILAKDFKAPPAWQPEQSTSGAKAALLAHKDAGKVEIWRPEATAWGNSAATQAFQKDRAGTLSPRLDYGHTDLGRKGSLLAATGAMATSRKRAESTPTAPPKAETYPDEANASNNALTAAKSSASRSTKRTGVSEGGAVPYTNMTRDMFTSHPPVAIEVEEQNRKDTLRASSIAMARQMYNIQQKQTEAASGAQQGAAAAIHKRSSSTSGADVQPMRFNNLQEAAHKLAQERLAKLHGEHDRNREYRDYYSGSNSAILPSPSSRLSIRGRTRHRSGSDGVFDEDREQSNKIRAQMSLFSSSLSQVDEKKRQADREALIAAAQRNVTKSLHGMDERVFADTGKVAPSLLDEWQLKAHAAAQAKSNDRMENYGKVNIGGGKFIDQSAVDLVAKKNVQPVLDEINDKAEKERERQAALKLDQENQKRKDSEKKAREKEEKEINKKLKRDEREERKIQEAEEKRLAKEKRKSLKSGPVAPVAKEPVKELVAESAVPAVAEDIETPAKEASVPAADEPVQDTIEPNTKPTTEPSSTTVIEPVVEAIPEQDVRRVDEPAETAEPVVKSTEPVSPASEPTSTTIMGRREVESAPAPIRTSMEDQASLRMQENADAANGNLTTPMSPNSPGGGKVKNWLKTKFSRRMSKSQKSPGLPEKVKEKDTPATEKAFVGGAALTGASANNSTTSLGRRTSPTREREVSLDRAMQENAEVRGRGNSRESDEVSALSEPRRGENEDEDFQEARDNFDEDLAPPPNFVAVKSSSPARETRFQEDI